ncbi:MAG: hypothetical protein U0168_04485 [Nannocystaceae bacterium]|jgi:hypothetical protein
MQRAGWVEKGLSLGALTLAVACGRPIDPGAEGSEGESGGSSSGDVSDSNTNTSVATTDVPPSDCVYGNQPIEHGATYETPDGCVTYRCDNGGLMVQDDQRTVVDGDLELATQAEVDAQACVGSIMGDLVVTGTAADLRPLAQLTFVGGAVDISASDAVSLTGLEQLGEIGAGLTIAGNAQLTSLAFQPYMSVFGDVVIDDNDALASLAGAGFIGQCPFCSGGDEGEATTGAEDPGGGDTGGAEEPGGTFYGNIIISNNDVLVDIGALGNLTYAWADVRFQNNAALASLLAMPLTQVRGDLEISNHGAMLDTEAQAFANGIDVWGTRTVCGNQGGVACP